MIDASAIGFCGAELAGPSRDAARRAQSRLWAESGRNRQGAALRCVCDCVIGLICLCECLSACLCVCVCVLI